MRRLFEIQREPEYRKEQNIQLNLGFTSSSSQIQSRSDRHFRMFMTEYLHFHCNCLWWILTFQMFAFLDAKHWTITWSDTRLGLTNVNVNLCLLCLSCLCDIIIVSTWRNWRIVRTLCTRLSVLSKWHQVHIRMKPYTVAVEYNIIGLKYLHVG